MPPRDTARHRDWLVRKQAYLAHLSSAPDAVLLVSACDKLHNAQAVLRDMHDPSVGMAVFERFKGGVEGTLWYYRALVDVFAARGSVVAPELGQAVGQLERLAVATRGAG